MRPLIIILVLANLGFAAWALMVDRPPAPPVARDISHLPGLVLASDPLPGSGPGADAGTGTVPRGHCVTVGPFSDLVLSAAASALLQTRGFTPTQRDEPGQDLVSYWVYLDNVPSEAAANRLLLMLRAIGLTDVHAMPVTTAGEARRVSVGLFTEKEGADRRARAVKAGLDVTPKVIEQHNSQASYWVDITLTSPGQSVSTEGLLPTGIKGGHLEIRDCPTPGAPPK